MEPSYSRDVAPRVALAFALVFGAVSPAAAQDSAAQISPRCQAPEHRQFDFWLGAWEVHNAGGELIGHNEIRRVANGCGLLESWRGAGGGQGVSINTFDPATGTWTQRWVGAGAMLWLEGGLQDGSMVLAGTGPRQTPQGEVLDRITWTPLPDGRVRQLWEVSIDGGATWRTDFVGFYERRAR